ncbi:hypothetical protein [Roseibacillus persicicus]|uniref:Uncharacterized protein n=1 Tax=Roseibacillus persicicus TaxID=454148 RepID=A0A918TE88_9BACT|nr:hypothetical protein [Roseibacillus persicicus]GHC43810.1 hypothetical protein GCM10007100_06240 [Roseibacillus persicicus]
MSTPWRIRIARIATREWLSLPRCFLITIGAIFLAVPGFALAWQGKEIEGWPLWTVILLTVLALVGLGIFAIGVLGDKKAAEQWARHCSRGGSLGGSVLIAIVAIPLFYLLKAFERK